MIIAHRTGHFYALHRNNKKSPLSAVERISRNEHNPAFH